MGETAMLTDALPPNNASPLARCVQEAEARLDAKPAAEALFSRATTAFMRELLALGPRLARQATDPEVLAQDDKTLLAELMIQALRNDPLTNKETRLRLQGQLAFRRQLEDAGGAYGIGEVADLLGITPDGVRKRTRRGRLLAVPHGEHSLYPAFQFDAGIVVPGFEDILALLDTDSAPAKVRFFVTPDAELDARPIDALRGGDAGQRALVERKARQFGRHTAR
jgi:hypothetical protein